MLNEEVLRDGELVFYVRHVVDELERFYPSEYRLLETLAVGDFQGFVRATTRDDAAAHLFRYGVVSDPEHPYITYEVLRDYVAWENARREGRSWRRRLVPENDRESFTRVRLRTIATDLRSLERLIALHNKPLLFGPNSFPEADVFVEVSPPGDSVSLGAALSTMNRCLVEAIDVYGRSLGKNKYFWVEIRTAFPYVFEALHRIRVYRHNSHHLTLHPGVEEVMRQFLDRDLDDALASSEERHWSLFQTCLDELFSAIQREISVLEG